MKLLLFLILPSLRFAIILKEIEKVNAMFFNTEKKKNSEIRFENQFEFYRCLIYTIVFVMIMTNSIKVQGINTDYPSHLKIYPVTIILPADPIAALEPVRVATPTPDYYNYSGFSYQARCWWLANRAGEKLPQVFEIYAICADVFKD